jgi:predicted dehydrogenase
MKLRAAVIGAGAFGRNHVRVISQLPDMELTAIIDTDIGRAHDVARQYGALAFVSFEDILDRFDAAIVATPTVTHESFAKRLLEAGKEVLIEKPIADASAAAERLARLAQERGRILQVGHLERFNPAVMAVQNALTIPLFFEIHRLSVFTPRSLDVDVVLDLMIHDLDIVLSFTRELPQDIRAAGISVLSDRVDIANVRLSFPSGCVANLTASRVSTEKVRKLRLFQPGEYISVDYERQDAVRLAIRKNEPIPKFVSQNAPSVRLRRPERAGFVSQNAPLSTPDAGFVRQIGFESLPVTRGEPLRLELEAFFAAVRNRSAPRVDALQAANVLRVAEAILSKIREHAELVSETLRLRS